MTWPWTDEILRDRHGRLESLRAYTKRQMRWWIAAHVCGLVGVSLMVIGAWMVLR